MFLEVTPCHVMHAMNDMIKMRCRISGMVVDQYRLFRKDKQGRREGVYVICK